MFHFEKYFWIFCASIVAIFTLGILTQEQLVFNDDASWLIHAGERLIIGGNYYDSFYEVNPPMSIFIYLPVVLINYLTHWGVIASARFYVFSLAMISWLFCYWILIKSPIFSRKNNNYFFLIVLAVVMNFLPGGSFGEREYIAILLVLPYLLTLNCYCIDCSLNKVVRLLACGMAALAFIIKPYFLLVWLLLEIYVAINKKTWRVWLRWENWLIGTFVLSYVAVIFLLTPQFVYEILPKMLAIYYRYYAFPLTQVLLDKVNLYCCAALILYFSVRKNLHFSQLADLLAVASLGFLLVALYQRVIWFYHFLPILFLLILTFTALLIENLFKVIHRTLQKNNLITMVLLSLVSLVLFLLLSFELPLNRNSLGQKMMDMNRLMPLLVQQKQPLATENSLVIFSAEMDTYPLVDYTGWYSPTRFPYQWALAYFDYIQNHFKNIPADSEFEKNKKYFVGLVVDDLIKYQPRLLIFLVTDPHDRRLYFPVNYLEVLKQDPRFADVWKNYQFQQRVGAWDVYERKRENM